MVGQLPEDPLFSMRRAAWTSVSAVSTRYLYEFENYVHCEVSQAPQQRPLVSLAAVLHLGFCNLVEAAD